MNTYVGLSYSSLNKRLEEIHLLVNQAESIQEEENLYNAICRSTQVLLVGHLEGAIKEMVKSLLDDLSMLVSFKDQPPAVKKTFTTFFIKSELGGKYNPIYQDRLIEIFELNNADLRVEPFFFEQNKNPSPFIIETIAKRLGISNVFSRFVRSEMDIAFEDSQTGLIDLRDRLKAHLEQALLNYPYQTDPSQFRIQVQDIKAYTGSLWNTFLDGILAKRHGIAHGATLSNEVEHTEILKSLIKVEVLLYGLYIVFCSEVVSKCR